MKAGLFGERITFPCLIRMVKIAVVIFVKMVASVLSKFETLNKLPEYGQDTDSL